MKYDVAGEGNRKKSEGRKIFKEPFGGMSPWLGVQAAPTLTGESLRL